MKPNVNCMVKGKASRKRKMTTYWLGYRPTGQEKGHFQGRFFTNRHGARLGGRNSLSHTVRDISCMYVSCLTRWSQHNQTHNKVVLCSKTSCFSEESRNFGVLITSLGNQSITSENSLHKFVGKSMQIQRVEMVLNML